MDNGSFFSGSSSAPMFWDVLIVMGAIAVVVLAVFFWALSSSSKGLRPHHHHSRHRKKAKRSRSSPEATETEKQSHRFHSRYPLNPTLAETGGLPPVHEDEPAEEKNSPDAPPQPPSS